MREYVRLLFLRSFCALKDSRNAFFKGGTAIHFHHGSFRYPEDLDSFDFSYNQHRFLILGNGSIAGEKQHPFCTGLSNEQAVERVFMKRRQRINPQGMFSGYGELRVSMRYEHFSQTIRINLEIFASEFQFDNNFPNTGRTEKQTILGCRQKSAR